MSRRAPPGTSPVPATAPGRDRRSGNSSRVGGQVPGAADQRRGPTGGGSSSAAAAASGSLYSRRRAAIAAMDPPLQTAAASSNAAQIEQLINETLGPSREVWRAAAPRYISGLPPDLISNSDKYSIGDVARKVGELASINMFDEALKLIEDISLAPRRSEALPNICQKYFMQCAAEFKASKAALGFVRVLPKRYQDLRLYTMVLGVCAASRDLETAVAAIDLAERQMFHLDTKLMTTLIKVCASMGRADRAFQVLADMKRLQLPLDGHVYGAIIFACAEAMQRELAVSHERKEQYVLLERAINLVAEAEAAGIVLLAPAWNALIVCAGRCMQLQRAFDFYRTMTNRRIKPNARTYGSLIEACVHSKQHAMALRIYRTALEKGFDKEVKIYTQAISACKIDGAVDLDGARSIYLTMQINRVDADKKLFAAMMAVAGKAGQLHSAFELLSDVSAEGLPLGSTLASALIYACQEDRNLPAARQVYDLCMQNKVFPSVSQYNRLMDWYATDCRFGDVVSLLSDMVQLAQCTPNLNTYRILINACQRAEQHELAMQVYSLLKANRVPILQQRFLHTIYLMIVKCCFNESRLEWDPKGHPPGYKQLHAPKRSVEAQKVLSALGIERHAKLAQSFSWMQADGVNWSQQAIAIYRDMLTRGHQPSLAILDLVLGCMRTPLPKNSSNNRQPSTTQDGGGGNPSSTQAQHSDTASAGGTTSSSPSSSSSSSSSTSMPDEQSWESNYEARFDRRATQILEDAISRGLLPAPKPEEQSTVDLRHLQPSLAEVYTLHLLALVERRAERDGWGSATRGKGDAGYFKPIILLVPPFQPDYIIWPSYVQKLTFHYQQPSAEEMAAALEAAKESQQEYASDVAYNLIAGSNDGGGSSGSSSSGRSDGSNGASTSGGAGGDRAAKMTVNGAQINGAQINSAQINGAQINGAQINGAALSSAVSTPGASADASSSSSSNSSGTYVAGGNGISAGNGTGATVGNGSSSSSGGDGDGSSARSSSAQSSAGGDIFGTRPTNGEEFQGDDDDDVDAMDGGSGLAAGSLDLAGGTADGEVDESDLLQGSGAGGGRSRNSRRPNPRNPRGVHGGGHTVTGLAVAATLKRMKCYVNMDYERGVLMLDSRELARWMGAKQSYKRRAKAEAVSHRSAEFSPPQSGFTAAWDASLTQQQAGPKQQQDAASGTSAGSRPGARSPLFGSSSSTTAAGTGESTSPSSSPVGEEVADGASAAAPSEVPEGRPEGRGGRNAGSSGGGGSSSSGGGSNSSSVPGSGRQPAGGAASSSAPGGERFQPPFTGLPGGPLGPGAPYTQGFITMAGQAPLSQGAMRQRANIRMGFLTDPPAGSPSRPYPAHQASQDGGGGGAGPTKGGSPAANQQRPASSSGSSSSTQHPAPVKQNPVPAPPPPRHALPGPRQGNATTAGGTGNSTAGRMSGGRSDMAAAAAADAADDAPSRTQQQQQPQQQQQQPVGLANGQAIATAAVAATTVVAAVAVAATSAAAAAAVAATAVASVVADVAAGGGGSSAPSPPPPQEALPGKSVWRNRRDAIRAQRTAAPQGNAAAQGDTTGQGDTAQGSETASSTTAVQGSAADQGTAAAQDSTAALGSSAGQRSRSGQSSSS